MADVGQHTIYALISICPIQEDKMAGANYEYAYGVCANYAKQLQGWEWVKSKRGYRNKIFKGTHLFVGPGKLTFGGGFTVSTGNAYIGIHNKYYAKIRKLIIGRAYTFYNYQLVSYYRDVMGEHPKDQPNYAHMVPELTSLYKNSRVDYSLLSEFPTVLEHIFERGKAIFDKELDYTSETDLLKSAILPESRVKAHINLIEQIVLRLIVNADLDFLSEAKNQSLTPQGETSIAKIEAHIDEIIAESPYLA